MDATPKPDFDELAGRIEGVGRALQLLVAMLEDAGVMSGPDYCQALNQSADGLRFPNDRHLPVARTLRDLASSLESARAIRRSRGG